MGNPFLLATDFQPTVTYGIVSATHRYQYPAGTLLEYTDCIQTDASINPGNSGGPLFDMEGRLVGINGRGSFEKRGRVNVGVGYAISINQIKNFLGCLRSGRIVDHANLNVRVTADESGRVVVSDILEQSDAYRRGLRVDDEMVSFGGRPISTPNGFKNVLGIFPKGWRVPMSFSPRRQAIRRDRAAGRAAQQRRPVGEDIGPPARAAMPIPKPGEQTQPEDKPGGEPQAAARAAEDSRRPQMREDGRSPAGARARDRQAVFRGEAGLRELLFQQAQSGPRLEGLGGPGRLRRPGRHLDHRRRLGAAHGSSASSSSDSRRRC